MQATQHLNIASVALDQALHQLLDYRVPDELSSEIRVGMRALIPLRSRLVKGTILSLKASSPFSKLQPIQSLITDLPPLPQELVNLICWVASYYGAPFHSVIKCLIPHSVRKESQERQQLFVKPLLSLEEMRKLCISLRQTAPSQALVLDRLLEEPKGLFLSELLKSKKFSSGTVKSLEKRGALNLTPLQLKRALLMDQEFFLTPPKLLNEEQKEALEKISKTLNENRFETHLLFGVTGSGKTEVYLQAIQHALSQNKQALFLVPEIALTSQTIERIQSRFGNQIAVIHHRLTPKERRESWLSILKGEANIVIGARSGIFSPLPRLGLIIIDEEHESSFKQAEEVPRYHARDAAVMRGKLAGCAVVLGSATPSLESYFNAQKGKYILSTLSKRAMEAAMPSVTIVDMRREYERAGGFTLFSEPLIAAIKKRIESGQQSLLFLNRRGYHTSALCLACSHVMKCHQCAVSLTHHFREALLTCHLCNYQIRPPRQCPECKKEGDMKYRGAGTEMVERALHHLLPEVRTLRLDSDTTQHKGSFEKIFKQFRAGKADVLIGTQMIAKGLDVPLVTLVAVLSADGSLNIPDFRTSEMVFQQITQVVGRAGRSRLKGEALIQTLLPDNQTLQFARDQNYTGFYRAEIENRELFNYPPFVHLVKCTFSTENEQEARMRAEEIRSALFALLPPSCQLLPVAAAGHAQVKNRFRFQFLIKTPSTQLVLPAIQKLYPRTKERGVFHLDVDPLHTFF